MLDRIPNMLTPGSQMTIRDYWETALPVRKSFPSTHLRSSSNSTQLLQIKGEPNSTNREDIQTSITEAGRKYDIPEDLISAVIQAESNFNPRAVSPAGAQGLMQLMPATARELGVSNSFDVRQNIDGGAKYLRKMMDKFNDVRLAVAAYNAGPGAVAKHGGIPPYAETRKYVQKVMKEYQA